MEILSQLRASASAEKPPEPTSQEDKAIKITPNLHGCKQGGIINPPASNWIRHLQPSIAGLARPSKGGANETGSSGLFFFSFTKISLSPSARVKDI